jgi:uroporphyrinogen III methyltransferase / synthase
VTLSRSGSSGIGETAGRFGGTAVLVTRPAGGDDALVARLAVAGIRVHAVPTVTMRPVPPGGDLDRAASDLPAADWVVLTSAAAFRALSDAVARVGASWPQPGCRPRFAAVGRATAGVLGRAGMTVAAISSDGTGLGLLPALEAMESLAGRRVVLPRASAADDRLPSALRERGADVRDVVAYETVEAPAESLPALLAALEDPDLRAVVVASGSAVRGLLGLLDLPVSPPDRVPARLRALPFVSIGPSTSDEVRRLGLELGAEASTPSVDALADAVLAFLAATRAPGLEVSR